MVRRLAVTAMLGGALIATVAPAYAIVSRPEDRRAVPGSDRQSSGDARPQSEGDTRALGILLDRSGLRTQLESLSAGVRLQFLMGQGRLSGEDRLIIDRIVSQRFSAGALYARMRLEFVKNLESARLAKALEWYDSPLGKRVTGLELASLIPDGGRGRDPENDRPSQRRLGHDGRRHDVDRGKPDPGIPARAARRGPVESRAARARAHAGAEPDAGAHPARVLAEHALRLPRSHGRRAGAVRAVRRVRGRPVVHEPDERHAADRRRRGRGGDRWG